MTRPVSKKFNENVNKFLKYEELMLKYAVDTQKRGPKLKKLTIERRNELFDDCWYSEERALRRFAKEEFGKLIIKSPRRVKIPPKLRPKRGRRPYIKISKWLSKLKKKYRHTYGHNQIYVFSNDEKCISYSFAAKFSRRFCICGAIVLQNPSGYNTQHLTAHVQDKLPNTS